MLPSSSSSSGSIDRGGNFFSSSSISKKNTAASFVSVEETRYRREGGKQKRLGNHHHHQHQGRPGLPSHFLLLLLDFFSSDDGRLPHTSVFRVQAVVVAVVETVCWLAGWAADPVDRDLISLPDVGYVSLHLLGGCARRMRSSIADDVRSRGMRFGKRPVASRRVASLVFCHRLPLPLSISPNFLLRASGRIGRQVQVYSVGGPYIV